jgi:hypothetical protein
MGARIRKPAGEVAQVRYVTLQESGTNGQISPADATRAPLADVGPLPAVGRFSIRLDAT